jgi:transcriptional regulator with XRE-family HTH domain
MKNYNKKIGAYLAKERRAKKISQQQLADRLGVSKTAVHYWETGKRTIYADQMLEYCEQIGIDPQELVKSVTGD